MGKAINGKFENLDQARNTRDDLIGGGNSAGSDLY